MLRANIEAALEADKEALRRANLELRKCTTLKLNCQDPVVSTAYKAELEYWEASKELYEIRIERLKDKLEEFENDDVITERLVVKGSMSSLVIREFATMRDGAIVVKVCMTDGTCCWLDLRGLEVIAI